jgi:hypothetical protein
MARATSSLPVPVSPVIKTLESVGATLGDAGDYYSGPLRTGSLDCRTGGSVVALACSLTR